MAFIQIFISWLGKTVSKLANATFGWAVVALFGRNSPREQTLLSYVVGMAALWPLLVVGIIFPRFAAFLIAFVPLARSVPTLWMRIIWIVAVVTVPVVVGIIMARKSPTQVRQENPVRRTLRGFPVTVGLAAAFFISFVTVPLLRLGSALRHWKNEHVPLITVGEEMGQAASVIDHLLEQRVLTAERARPPWWMSAPTSILHRLGGKAFQGLMSEESFYWKGEALQIALYPSDVLVRGPRERAAWTHGLLAERFAFGPGVQTYDPDAQQVEREAHRVWRVLEQDPPAHARSTVLRDRVLELTRDLGKLDLPYDEWQIVYRTLAQLARAVEDEPQLLSAATEDTMQREDRQASPEAKESTPSLLGRLFHDGAELIKKEMELARTEISEDMKAGVGKLIGFATAALFGVVGLGLFAAAAVLALATRLPAWESALLVGVAFFVIAGIAGAIARAKKVGKLERTQRTVKEDVRWAKERMA